MGSLSWRPTLTITVIGRRVINYAGLAILKKWEGCELEAYLCPAKVWTIGYGSTGPHVKPGLKITQAEAERLLDEDLKRFEIAVAKAAPRSTADQFSAMVCLAFNIGLGSAKDSVPGFLTSTLLRRHLVGDHKGAAAAFGMWCKADGQTLSGLVKRRADEAKLYLKGS